MHKNILSSALTSAVILVLLTGCQAEPTSDSQNQQGETKQTTSASITVLPGQNNGTASTQASEQTGITADSPKKFQSSITQEQKTSIVPASTTQYSVADQAAYNSAMQTKDTAFCDKIQDQEYKKQCSLALTATSTLQEAVAKLDVTLCAKLTLKDDQDYCRTQVEAGIALNQKMEATKK